MADVARASTSVPVGIDSGERTILQQVLRDAHRGGQSLGSPETGVAETAGDAQSGAVPEARNAGFDFFSSYRLAARRYRAANAGPVRGLFNQFDQAWLAAERVEPLPVADLGMSLDGRSQVCAPAVAVVEHLGSPAP